MGFVGSEFGSTTLAILPPFDETGKFCVFSAFIGLKPAPIGRLSLSRWDLKSYF